MNNNEHPQQSLIDAQEARWADPAMKKGAEAKVKLAAAYAGRHEWRAQLQLKQLRKVRDMKHKLYWLRQLADGLAESVAPYAACASGCSGCCYQPVMVTQAEANVIAKETGASLAQPPQWRTEVPEEYTGEACPFLQERRCGIYAHRPMACRLLFNMDEDALLCQIVPGSPIKVPYADARAYHALYLEAHIPRIADYDSLEAASDSLRMADLREFFPSGLQMTLPLESPT